MEDLEARLATKLDPLDALARGAERGDFDLNPENRPEEIRTLTPAAVLAPIVRRPEGWTMLLTQRTETMPTHAGQVAFPGGRIAQGEGAVAAALREAEEETGVARTLFRPLGGFGSWETGTGYRITPVVAFIEPGFTLAPDPREVAAVFETPLTFLFDPKNHETRQGEWRGQVRTFYAMTHGGRYIWGATAGMIRALYERLYT